MASSPQTIARRASLAVISISTLLGGSAVAIENQKSIYLFGVRASMAGMGLPPGFYGSSFTYFYSGRTSGSPRVSADVVLDVVSMLWVAPEKLMGGSFGVGLYVPFGRQKVSVQTMSALPPMGWQTLASSSAIAVGDPLPLAFIGWQSGNFHWKLSGMINVPIGGYSRNSIANIGFNRSAAILTGSMTWFDPASGLEVSISPGVTFNGENSATNYRSGTELHIEGAVMRHFSPSFSFGLAGYYYRQISGDSGAGAVWGPFKGEVSALGPNVSYNFKVGKTPVYASARWLREFNASNRLKGNVGFLTLSIPLAGLSSL
jgi:hypothetical protein